MLKQAILVLLTLTLVSACATDPSKLRLSDLGTRHWKGTVYLSVKETPTSIKCSVDPGYQSIDEIPVTYQGEDALPMFDLSDDVRKIRELREECLQRSKAAYP